MNQIVPEPQNRETSDRRRHSIFESTNGHGVQIEYDEDADQKANDREARIRNRVLRLGSVNETDEEPEPQNEFERSRSRTFSKRLLTAMASLSEQRPSMSTVSNGTRMPNPSAFFEAIFSGPWIERDASMTDISRQAEEQDIFIRMDPDEIIVKHMCPPLTPYFLRIYQSKGVILLFIVISVVVYFTGWWLSLFLALIGMVMVLNYPLMYFMLCHSVELYLMELCGVTFCICNAVLETLGSGDIDGWTYWFHAGTRFVTGIVFIFICHCLDGYHGSQLVKICVLLLLIGATSYHSVASWSDDESKDIKLLVPVVEQSISIQGLMKVAALNVTMLFINRLRLTWKHAGHIHIATYPEIVWLEGDHEFLRQSIASAQERQLSRTLTFSLDIYKQSVTQKAEIYLNQDKDIHHLVFDSRIASKLTSFHFSRGYLGAIMFLSFAIIMVTIFQLSPIVSLTYKIVVIVLLFIGAGTFNVKMMKHYLSTFDFYYKLMNWTLYVFGDVIWSTFNKTMTITQWIDDILLQWIFSMVILFIICIDSYHISHRYKVRALSFLIGVILYYQFCVFAQRHTMDPWVTWENRDFVIPVFGFKTTLKELLMQPLAALTLFIGKQLLIVKLHPNKAVLQMYPTIKWIDEEGERKDNSDSDSD